MYKTLLSISLCIAPLWLGAQTAEDYFHGGAKSYIWGKDREAKTQIFTGLGQYPNDPLLNGMAGLLKKEEQHQQQNQNQQQQDQQKNQDQQQQQQAQQNQKQDSSQQQKSEEQKQQAQQAEQQKQDQQQAQQSSGQPKDKSDEKEQEAATAQALAQMTPEQAKQLLDAQKGEEQILPLKPTGKSTDRSRPVKDW